MYSVHHSAMTGSHSVFALIGQVRHGSTFSHPRSASVSYAHHSSTNIFRFPAVTSGPTYPDSVSGAHHSASSHDQPYTSAEDWLAQDEKLSYSESLSEPRISPTGLSEWPSILPCRGPSPPAACALCRNALPLLFLSFRDSKREAMAPVRTSSSTTSLGWLVLWIGRGTKYNGTQATFYPFISTELKWVLLSERPYTGLKRQ